MRSIAQVVIHCSATPNGVWVAPEQIDAWHAARGYLRDPVTSAKLRPHLKHIGFHRLVQVDGSLMFCREVGEEASALPGTIAFCMVGATRFFLRQWSTLRGAVCALAQGLAEKDARATVSADHVLEPAEALQVFERLDIRVLGHRDLAIDEARAESNGSRDHLGACPGFDVGGWLRASMRPPIEELLDNHPAIADPWPLNRAVRSMRYGYI